MDLMLQVSEFLNTIEAKKLQACYRKMFKYVEACIMEEPLDD